MKIIFVHPNWTERLGRFAGLAKKRSPAPNLGVLYLATVAEKRGHTVEVVDADVENYTTDDIISHILKNRFDIVGITATTPIFHKAVQLAKLLKENQCDAKILIGGAHFNIFKKEAFCDYFDYGFFGEAEYTFDQFLNIIENGSDDFDGMKGFVYRKGTDTVETAPAEPIQNLDALNFPAMHLLKLDRYSVAFSRKYKPKRIMSVLPTRGCPFKCVFCCEPLLNNKFRYRSPKNLVDEIEKWHKELGATHFWFSDSTMTLKRERIEGICHEIIKRNLKITFEGSTRANLVDEELLRLMRSAGLIRISFGLESADPEVLKIIRKGITAEDVKKAVELADRLDIETNVSTIIGLPGDTRDSIEKTVNFIRNIPQILFSTLAIANPYPGSEMYGWSLEGKHGFHLLIDDFSLYSRYDFSPVRVNDLGPEELVRLQKTGLLKIHLTPRRMLTALRMIGLLEISKLFMNFLMAFMKELFNPNNAFHYNSRHEYRAQKK